MRRTTLLRFLSTTLFGVTVAAFAASSCSLITDSDIAAGGIGMACASDDDCQGGSCDQGACVAPCSADGDCPETSQCMGGRCVVEAVVGQPCTSASDCKGARCDDGLCVTKCETAADCPDTYRCLDTTCKRPLKVGGMWIGVAAASEGWTLTHQVGIEAAVAELGYVDFSYKELILTDGAPTAIDEFVADGAEVVIANSWDYYSVVQQKSETYPDVKFLHCSGFGKEPNVAGYFGHMEQAWFVAGRIAAQKTKTDHLGFIGSYVNGEVVRHINAFTLGARFEGAKTNRDIKVEVRWLGFWFDTDNASPKYEYTPLHMGDAAVQQRLPGEEYLTAKLIDSGADVITHNLDNQLPSRYVAKHTSANTLKDPTDTTKNFEVWTIGNDNEFGWKDQSGEPYVHSIGSTFWNWRPMYVKLFEDIHKGQFVAQDYMSLEDLSTLSDADSSIVSFSLNTTEPDINDDAVRKFLADAADAGWQSIFTGPITVNGTQRTDIPSGEFIGLDEWRAMCYFVDGVVERSNPNDPTSSLEPALVPGPDHPGGLTDVNEPPEGTPRQPTTAPEALITFTDPPSAMWDCGYNSQIPQ